MKPLAATIISAVLTAATPALAAPPELTAYVTDDDKDVYVALYDGAAVELSGCPSEAAARALMALSSAVIEETTLPALQAAHDLSHPKIPCSADAGFDADFAATTSIWFDVAGTKRYYLPSPSVQGAFYSVPSRCEAIKEAFAMRQRITLPGVLQAQTAPPAGVMTKEIVLDCGDGSSSPIDPDDDDDDDDSAISGDHWSLHRTEVFLSEASVGDTIYVAIYNRVAAGAVEKSYLPIYRINGAPSGEAVWEGSSRRETVEVALAGLFGTDPAQGVTTLGFEDVAKLDAAPYIDLCLTSCDGYAYQHAFFAEPGQLFNLTTLPPPIASQGLGVLGEPVLRWDFAHERSASFSGCDRLAAAMGMAAPVDTNIAWGDAIDATLSGRATAAKPFGCAAGGPDLCLRSVPDGGILSQATFSRDAGCQSAKRLRIELPAAAQISSALVLDAASFADVEIVPHDPLGRSLLTASPQQAGAHASACPFEAAPAIIHAKGLSQLRMERIDLVRSDSSATHELTALILENARVALDHVAIGTMGDGRRAIERSIRLCNAELYTLGGSFNASLLGLHGLNSRVSIAGAGAADVSTIVAGSFGLFMMSGSTVRLTWTALTAPRAILLRAADLKGSRVDLASGETSSTSSAFRLERGASAALSVSSARGFACLGVFLDASASAQLSLPTNKLVADNTRISCGPGSVEVIE